MRIGLFLAIVMWSTLPQAQQVYDGYQAFKDVREGYLIVRLPGFEKKLQVIDSLLESPDLSDRSVNILYRERARSIADRELIQRWYPVVFDSAYTFSKTAYIYTHETDDFEAGRLRARNASGDDIEGVVDGPFIFATLEGLFGDPLTFSSHDHQVIGYPMPEKIEVPGVLALTTLFKSMPEWMKDAERSSDIYAMYLHVTRLNRRFEKTYAKRIIGVVSPMIEEAGK